MGYGIDFGTTNSVAAFCDARTGNILPFVKDGRPHPSVVWMRPGGQVVVGADAKARITEFAEVPGNQFLSSIKRQLGRETSFHLFGEQREPFEIASEVFRHLKNHAKQAFKHDLAEAIVTVPVYYGGDARREIRKAADKAGVYIKTFVHEPFAALVGYVFAKGGRRQLENFDARNVLVFDWGGGTLDITVVEILKGQIIERAVAGIEDRAGDYFDNLLQRDVRRRVLERNGWSPEHIEISPGALDRLRAECERVKIQLSTSQDEKLQVAQAVKAAGKTVHISELIQRREFEELIDREVREAMQQVDIALDRAQIQQRQVDMVLLVGGSSRVPLVRGQLQERFGARLVDAPNADTLIAEGAAAIDALRLEPVLARPIRVELSDGSLYTVFESGHPARSDACNKTVNFFCTDNRGGEARLVMAGDSSRTGAARFTLNVPVSRELNPNYTPERVVVQFFLDQDMILKVAGKGATQSRGAEMQIHDLCFGLSL